jgi:hypothetical protein
MLLEEPSLPTTFLRCLFIFISPLHVSAIFRRNTQLFSGSYLTTTDPLFLYYRYDFVYGLPNTAVVYLISRNVKTLKC